MPPVTMMTLVMFSRWRTVMRCSKPSTFRATIISVSTMAKPLNTAPATKYGGKMVACQPGMTEVAKSIDTMVCTESTSGVARPARRR